ncbi:hypothetical protein LPJ56_006078 [Coemansia sp. RSA 2599]|nr:hypothetical protein LPJ75_006085 [Coemansia sp. RSA 2598]KAJ1808701.1 hypothetical protein LPJ56_006078 [Coemansia sp. RSA 2599]
MKFFTAILVAATTVIAQQVGSEDGPSVSSGPAAVSNPNVNNGWQAQNSLFNTGSDGGNIFENLSGNSFSKSIGNSATNDNNFINPSQTRVSGNTGLTTNGEGNHIGDVFTGQTGGWGWGGFHKRDAVFNNYGYGHARAAYPVAAYDGYRREAAPVYAHPVAYAPHPVAYAPARPVAYAPPRPVAYAAPHPAAYAPAYHPAYPVANNYNHQQASIVQNQA